MTRSALLVLCLAATSQAAGLDRDSLLTEAPAAPEAGTVRITGAGNSSYVGTATGGVSGTVMWAIFPHFAADVGAYFQSGEAGPSVRVRYQFLTQADHGLDMAAGLRYKSVGFDPRNGELEVLLALGRSFGRLDTILNVVGGHELGGPGADLELKALIGYRVLEPLRVGVDFRAQSEVIDENGWKVPSLADDTDLTGGASVSWLPLPKLQLQLLAGVTKPRGHHDAGPVGFLFASYDF